MLIKAVKLLLMYVVNPQLVFMLITVSMQEFIAIFKTLGQSLDHDDVRELVYQMDTNDDGKINLEEFSKMLRKHAI